MLNFNSVYGFLLGVIITALFLYQPKKYPDFLMLPALPDQYVNIRASNIQPTDVKQSRWKYLNIKKEKLCLAKNIYFEARGQDLKGQIAVALVTFNRVESKHFPNSICNVVWQKRKSKRTGKMVAQFSWTLDDIDNTPPNSKLWEESKRLVGAILAENSIDNISDFTSGSQHYHNTSVDPYWNKKMTVIASIGDHIFYIH